MPYVKFISYHEERVSDRMIRAYSARGVYLVSQGLAAEMISKGIAQPAPRPQRKNKASDVRGK